MSYLHQVPELDAKIAGILGWSRSDSPSPWWSSSAGLVMPVGDFSPSSNIAHALDAWDRLCAGRELGKMSLSFVKKYGALGTCQQSWTCTITFRDSQNNPVSYTECSWVREWAICNALLAAAKEKP